MYGQPGGGYDLGGTWRPHTGRSEWVASDYGGGYPHTLGGYCSPYESMYGSPYNYMSHGNYYNTPLDYYGSYNSLSMYEEQLRMMQGISEAERLARWQARIQFEELCEEERALRYARMADEERMRLGLWGDSYWTSRYGGGGYNMPLASSYSARISPWHSSRLPLSSSLSSRFSPMYGSSLGGSGLTYPSAYGGSLMGGPINRRCSKELIKAEIDEARRLRRHEIAHARQARRLMLSH